MKSSTEIPLLNFIKINKYSTTPIYLQIANQLSNAIQRNYIPKGTKLLGTRKLSELLHINRNTVVAAYQELEAQGWIITEANRGSYTCDKIKNKPEKLKATDNTLIEAYPNQSGFSFNRSNILDTPYEKVNTTYFFTDGTPDNRIIQLSQLSSFYSASMKRKNNKKRLNSNSYESNTFFLENMVNYLNISRGLQISTSNILITNSSEMSIYIASEVLLNAGDKVIVADLSYFSSNMTFQNKQANVLTVPVDQQGIDVDAIEKLCEKHTVRLLYITPHHHYPTTSTLSAQRRVKLLNLSNQYGFIILEDDYDYEFHYESTPLLPLASSDKKGMVVYTGTLGLSLIPGFKLGFIIAPKNVIQEMRKHLNVINPKGDILLQQVLGELIDEGEINRYLKKSLKVYTERRNQFCDLLERYFGEAVSFQVPSGGLAVWTLWKKGINLLNLKKKALDKNLFIPKTILYQNKDITAMRLGFGHLDKEEMEVTISLLHQSMLELEVEKNTTI
ncbi:aminotransferase-like domain-containing protein [Myroides pelagicus]|uniref:Aminotransferase class I/II-fold pyridoxal phosphate-dependent enzyme n=1 Tax=Myroides pelagicus TaxID=270914 RepID=A0A7K1GNE5_9FLAO|nr:PLP-dependent aminotransferase family protein [Myroides pelagicus]MEC4113874.1 PLP-dependent aminotransferase family protein [Myroides pelagicus]MTH30432.1 aminotransferase class I/II-fold pyridoxal phosphate-dependent enzyme [Myroides pelagicus]